MRHTEWCPVTLSLVKYKPLSFRTQTVKIKVFWYIMERRSANSSVV
jgi:hypothetical protein